MRSLIREAQAFNAVAAGQTANLSVPVGGSAYYCFFLEHLHSASTAATEAVFKANIESIKIKLDGEPLWDISGTDLVNLNNFYGYPMAGGIFPIMFARPEMADPAEELRFALGTGNLRQLTVEIKLAGGAVAPELKMWMSILAGVSQNTGSLIRIRKTVASAQAAAGIRELHDLPLIGPEAGRGLKAIHFMSGNITEHDVIMNGVQISEVKSTLLNVWQDIQAFQTVSRYPVANVHHVDFAGNRYSGMIPTTGVSDLRFKLTFTGAEPAFDVIHEEVFGLPG